MKKATVLVAKCGDCPEREFWTSAFKGRVTHVSICSKLNQTVDPDTIPDDCPLEDADIKD